MRPELKQGLTLFVVGIVATIVAIVCVHKLAILTESERLVEDIRTATLAPPEPQDPQVVIVGITEETLRQFPYRSPVDRDFLADLLRTLEARHPRAIGLDVLFDQATEPGKDARLRAVMTSLSAPLFVSYTDDPGVVDGEQRQFLDGFLPSNLRVRAELSADPLDGTVRWVYPGSAMPDGRFVPGFARGIAASLGVETPAIEQEAVWHGRPDRETSAFRVYPAHMVPVLPADWFRDKVVLIGEMVSLTDRHRTPFSVVYPGNTGKLAGIEIHAHAVSQFLNGRYSRKATQQTEVVSVLLAAALATMLSPLFKVLAKHLLLASGVLAVMWVSGFALYHFFGLMLPLIEPSIAFLLATGGANALIGHEARRQREFISQAFAQYVNPQLLDKISQDPKLLALGGESREMTVMFCDIRGFTTLSERYDAQGLTRFLNSFHTPMTDVILESGGTIDKYIGDAIMAFWNAPAHDRFHAEHACRTALEMRRKLIALNVVWRAEAEALGQPFEDVRIGIGLNTGTCHVGNMGSAHRFDYSVIGDEVNLASRLEGQTKTYGVDIIVGEGTAQAVQQLATLEMDLILVKGKTQPAKIFALLDDETLALSGEFGNLRAGVAAMLTAYRSGDWHSAKQILAECRENAPEQLKYFFALYEERIAAQKDDPPPADWDGVYLALTK